MIASAALLAALAADPDAASCSRADLRAAAAGAQISTLGHVGGAPVVLAGPHADCLCGNVNCPWYVLRIAGATPRVLLETSGYEAEPVAGGAALPRVRITSHDSALISYRTVYAYRDGAYVSTATWIVRGDTGASKPTNVPVHFAPGTSSAALHGSVSQQWGDTYAVVALRGQRLTLATAHAAPGMRFALLPVDGAPSIALTPGVAATLPASGTYLLTIDNDADAATPYALTLTIR